VAAGAEVSLSGELRPITGLDRRLREAARRGYRTAIVAGDGRRELDGLSVIGVPTLRAALEVAIEPGAEPLAEPRIAKRVAVVTVGGDRPE
jgi:DNA repair protein RadA/Sms